MGEQLEGDNNPWRISTDFRIKSESSVWQGTIRIALLMLQEPAPNIKQLFSNTAMGRFREYLCVFLED